MPAARSRNPEPAASGQSLAGARPRDGLQNSCILVVEDEFFSALQLESILGHVGCTVVGPMANLDDALKAAREETVDAALLDISISGELVYPVADVLRARGIPLLFVTGHRRCDLPERYRACPQITKPYSASTLVGALRQLV